MLCQVAFVVFLLLVNSLCSCQGDDSDDFVRTKEEEVKSIAEAAQDNYFHSCELISTCLSPQNCSRLECYPLQNQSSETTCVYVDNNRWCTNSTGAPCNTVEANFERGYVRTPPLNFSSVGGTLNQDRELYLGNTICTQRRLDDTFMRVNKTLRSNSTLNYFYNVYFGSVDGSFRYYPGRELVRDICGVYDPRIRPWYTGAISILKDVVVLIDTGSAMQQTNFLDPTTSYLEITQSMLSLFVKTLTGGDRVTVVPVNESGSYPGSQYSLPANEPLDPTDPDFGLLLSYIANSSALAGNGDGRMGPTNFTDGFVAANSTFANTSPMSSMKIVILVTNSHGENVPGKNDTSAADYLRNLGSQLFVYDLNPYNPRASGWGSHACLDEESQNNVSINPLLWLNSYFSFLARARIAGNGGPTPFWQNPYTDASDLGQVITVAYPAMSADGLQLIGVAGIDVQLAGLDSDPVLKAGVESVLTTSSYRLITLNPEAANISICNSEYLKTCPGITAGRTESLCIPSQQMASDKQLTALLCCEDCTSSGPKLQLPLWIVVGLLGAVLLLLVLMILYLWRRSKRRRASASRRKELALNVFSYDVLRKATNGFASKNVIGRGSFGVVYKATLGDEAVAVKQLNQPADRAQDFEAEIKILGITSHPNLVELKGACFRPTQCFLVYELVNSGDLHDWLWPVQRTGSPRSSESDGGIERFLTWNRRRKIARGIARGLNYLHRGLEPNGTVFHLDIKPHNILLEYNFNPKIADFGISQLYEPGFTFKCASVVRGTFGYIAPEVLHGQMKPNSKLDVYSYGMVLLQLMSGRKIDDPEVKPFLLQWARNHVEDGYVEKVVDESLLATVQEEFRDALMANCKQMIRLALLCLSDRPEWRPEMSEVLQTIDGLQEVIDLETPSFSDWEGHGSGPEDSTDVDLQKPPRRSSFGGSRELNGSFRYFRSESGNEVRSTEGKSEISPSVSSPVTAGKGQGSHDNFSQYSQEGSSVLGRKSVDTTLKRVLEMANVQFKPRSSLLRRSFSN